MQISGWTIQRHLILSIAHGTTTKRKRPQTIWIISVVGLYQNAHTCPRRRMGASPDKLSGQANVTPRPESRSPSCDFGMFMMILVNRFPVWARTTGGLPVAETHEPAAPGLSHSNGCWGNGRTKRSHYGQLLIASRDVCAATQRSPGPVNGEIFKLYKINSESIYGTTRWC